MNHAEQEFLRFQNVPNHWKQVYKYVGISYLAVKKDKTLYLLYGRVIFHFAKPNIKDFRLNTSKISAANIVVPLSEAGIDVYLNEALQGRIAQTNKETFPALEGENLSVYVVPPFQNEVNPSFIRFLGNKRYDLINSHEQKEVDAHLKSLSEPFDSIDDLLSFCGLPLLNQIGDNVTLELGTLIPAFIRNDSSIQGKKLCIKCVLADGLNINDLRVGFKIFKGQLPNFKVERGSEGGNKFNLQKDKETIIATFEKELDEEVPAVQLYISYKDICLSQGVIQNPLKSFNSRLVIHETFDSGLDILKRFLKNPDKDSRKEFEPAITALLHLYGFSVINYGKIPKMSEGPDVIAISPTGNVLVVECTTGHLDNNDKLAKLDQRKVLIRRKLTEAGFSNMDIQAVIVTSCSKDEVKAHIGEAEKLGIAVVTKEIIDSSLLRITIPPNPDDLFKEIKGSVRIQVESTIPSVSGN